MEFFLPRYLTKLLWCCYRNKLLVDSLFWNIIRISLVKKLGLIRLGGLRLPLAGSQPSHSAGAGAEAEGLGLELELMYTMQTVRMYNGWG